LAETTLLGTEMEPPANGPPSTSAASANRKNEESQSMNPKVSAEEVVNTVKIMEGGLQMQHKNSIAKSATEEPHLGTEEECKVNEPLSLCETLENRNDEESQSTTDNGLGEEVDTTNNTNWRPSTQDKSTVAVGLMVPPPCGTEEERPVNELPSNRETFAENNMGNQPNTSNELDVEAVNTMKYAMKKKRGRPKKHHKNTGGECVTNTALIGTESESQENEPPSTSVTWGGRNDKERQPINPEGLAVEVQERNHPTSKNLYSTLSALQLPVATLPSRASVASTVNSTSPPPPTNAVEHEQHKNCCVEVDDTVDSSIQRPTHSNTMDEAAV